MCFRIALILSREIAVGNIMTLSGGTGAGKTSIARVLLKLLPDTFFMVTSLTTREARESDLNGEYLYKNDLDIGLLDRDKKLLWWRKYGGIYYATTSMSVRDALYKPGIGIMIITPDCVPRLHSLIEEANGPNDILRSFYIESPSISEIKKRLTADGTRHDALSRMSEEQVWRAKAKLSGKFIFVRNEQDRLENTVKKIRSHLDLSVW